ncbi:hypothetical protein G6F24_012374 [Rhizopus arrhizus]|nr:hypothetical protein G6F24_012374 [Rhizopus arrhizus]
MLLARTVGVPALSPSAEVKGVQRSSDPLRRAAADRQGAQAIACDKLADHFRAYARRDALQQPCRLTHNLGCEIYRLLPVTFGSYACSLWLVQNSAQSAISALRFSRKSERE